MTATWIIVGGAVILALIIGAVVVISLVATRQRSGPVRIPGLSRMMDRSNPPAPPAAGTEPPTDT
jgi:hypothetical protein